MTYNYGDSTVIKLHSYMANCGLFFTESGIDYLPIIAEQFPLDVFLAGTSTRRDCFHLSILDDNTAENDEVIFLDLSLDTRFGPQDGTRITLNSTRVTIVDNDN